MRFFTEFPRSEVFKIIKNIPLSTLWVRKKYDFFGENITVFFLYFRPKVSLIFAKTLNYQPHGVSRKYELLAEDIGLFSNFSGLQLLGFPLNRRGLTPAAFGKN